MNPAEQQAALDEAVTGVSRRTFLRRLFLPLGGAVVGVAAKTLDPGGEPVPEEQAMIVVNAPGVTLQNLNLTSGISRRTAIQLTKEANTARITGTLHSDGAFRGPWS